MTTREMLIEFERQVQAIYPDFDTIAREQMNTDSIMYFINLAEDRYLKENYLNKEQIKESVEYINKRSDVLRNLITRLKDQDNDTVYTPNLNDGGIQLDLPDDYLFYMKSFANMSRTDEYAEVDRSNDPATPIFRYMPTRMIMHSDLDMVTINTINKPILRMPCVLLEGEDKIIIYKDAYTNINNFEIIYIREPKRLVLGTAGEGETNESELAPHTHIEITQLAAKMFIEEYKFKLSRGGQQ